MKPNFNPNVRPLAAKLDAYTENDLSFKQELIRLMIGNLQELQMAVTDSNTFASVTHKVKSTLSILDDTDVNSLVTELKTMLKRPADLSTRVKTEQFFQLIEHLIKDLEDEASIQKAS